MPPTVPMSGPGWMQGVVADIARASLSSSSILRTHRSRRRRRYCVRVAIVGIARMSPSSSSSILRYCPKSNKQVARTSASELALSRRLRAKAARPWAYCGDGLFEGLPWGRERNTTRISNVGRPTCSPGRTRTKFGRHRPILEFKQTPCVSLFGCTTSCGNNFGQNVDTNKSTFVLRATCLDFVAQEQIERPGPERFRSSLASTASSLHASGTDVHPKRRFGPRCRVNCFF